MSKLQERDLGSTKNDHSTTALAEITTPKRRSPYVVHLLGKKGAGPSLPSAHPPQIKAVGFPALGLSRSHSARPLGKTLLVKAEFVFADPGVQSSVTLLGDWDDWEGTSMNMEEENLWSCIAILPTGHRQFYFLVDGKPRLSSRHPVSPCGTKNWRNVHGPRQCGGKTEPTDVFYRWMQERLEGLGVAVAPGGMDDSLMGVVGGMELPATVRKRNRAWERIEKFGWGTVALFSCSIYLVGVAVYSLLFSERRVA